MFTGLVQAVGRLRRHAHGVTIEGLSGLDPLALGDSVAVDGVCLTVSALMADAFRADVSEETLRRSTLAAKAEAGAAVNLEPALRLSDRLGGHLVSGHVDGLGKVLAVTQDAGAWRLELAWEDPAYGRYVCDKASVAVDGISLTVAGSSLAGERFWIAVIPHTWGSTTLLERQVGDRVNLEADLLAKYTERLLQQEPQRRASEPPLDRAWLAEHGWG
ncbi:MULTISPECIES: riboflavin synthase [unclassified Synechococcus]|uniref:riboflavin synthase n=1 Tax=unclassified Synechococcus TaxID=2626047 RepID=UPI00006995E6|nr:MULTISPECIES: riboflavin synthase [unclassified Synechococcus]EAQ74500.1 riboflavin synthase subunit alpha [Synechococcus sp. WH 5701]WFN60260.1 riboflavin synthase [Synechococcus sp. CCFWC 502]CAK6700444.1 Riboflavin synthase [Synechococcus sp. CBW1107]